MQSPLVPAPIHFKREKNQLRWLCKRGPILEHICGDFYCLLPLPEKQAKRNVLLANNGLFLDFSTFCSNCGDNGFTQSSPKPKPISILSRFSVVLFLFVIWSTNCTYSSCPMQSNLTQTPSLSFSLLQTSASNAWHPFVWGSKS